jgi:hypothetical protein
MRLETSIGLGLVGGGGGDFFTGGLVIFGLLIGDKAIGGLIGFSLPGKCCVLGEGRGGDGCFLGE